MNYKKCYQNLINNAKTKNIKKFTYYEKHHIDPKCIGGSDDPDNIVKLTAREHFIAHLLLTKIYRTNLKIAHAALSMTRASINSKIYEKTRINLSKIAGIRVSGSKNPMYGKNAFANKTEEEMKEIKNKCKNTWKNKSKMELDLYKQKCKLSHNIPHSENTKLKISKSLKGRYCGSNNPSWTGHWVTPNGSFESRKEAAIANGISIPTLRKYCKILKCNGWGFIPK